MNSTCRYARLRQNEFFNVVLAFCQSNQALISCFELVAVQLNAVPPAVVQEQFERLWQKVMNYDE